MLIIANSPFVFGYAKPVPVNFNNLRNPKRDMIWVALAGPVTNLVLAVWLHDCSGRCWRRALGGDGGSSRRDRRSAISFTVDPDGSERHFDQYRLGGV